MDNNGALAPSAVSCLCNDGDGNSAQEGSGYGALTSLIAPCSRDYDGSGGGGSADHSTSASLVVLCLCGDNSGCGMQDGSDDGALASLVLPCSWMTTTAAVRERVAMMLPQHRQSPYACATTSTAALHERVEAMAPIFPYSSCDDDDGGSGAEDGASVLSILLRSCSNNGGISAGEGAFSLLVVPCSHEQEGGMIRGDATASWRVARGGGVRRADMKRMRHNERRRNNQLAHQ